MNELFGFSTNPKTTHVKKGEKKRNSKRKEKKEKRTNSDTDKTNREHGVQIYVETSTEWRNEDFSFLTGAPLAVFPLTLRKCI